MALIHRAKESIAQISLTNSKHPESHIEGVYPTHVVKGRGGSLLDEHGNWYVDYICGLGTNLLGYTDNILRNEILASLDSGNCLSFPAHHEIEAAELLKCMFPFSELVKFVKTGTEACMAAIRIARVATGRMRVLSEGYHGWSDPFVSLVAPAAGVPSPLAIESFTDLSQIDNTIAAVIVEPVMLDYSEKRKEWLTQLRAQCTNHGVVLIFDEIITGFRFEKYSVTNAWGVIPDLICLGKAMGNGFPISCVAGKKSIMDTRQYFVSGTFAGEHTGLVAAKCVMSQLLKGRVALPELIADALRARKEWASHLDKIGISLVGYPMRGAFEGDLEVKAQFFSECAKRRVLFGPSFFWCLPHQNHRPVTDVTVASVCSDIKAGKIPVPAKLPRSAFAAKARGQ